MNDDLEQEGIPLADIIDTVILLHREAHFGGNFDFMLEYYQREGRGVHPEIDYERIEYLAESEKKLGQNIAALFLMGADAEKIARSKNIYKQLRDLYEQEEKEKIRLPLLIADLILTEDPEAKKEIAAIIAEKEVIVPSLLEVLRAPYFYDPVFPGYGQTPEFVIKCLGMIGDKRSIISLFESIGEGDFFNEDLAIEGLRRIGKPAKEFLLHVLHARPFTTDNERAAIALIGFREEPEVADICLGYLLEPEVRQTVPLANYLVLVCEGLTDEHERQKFIALADDPVTPETVQQEMLQVSKGW